VACVKKRLVALYLLGCLVGHSGNLSMVVDEKVEEKEHGDSKPENICSHSRVWGWGAAAAAAARGHQ